MHYLRDASEDDNCASQPPKNDKRGSTRTLCADWLISKRAALPTTAPLLFASPPHRWAQLKKVMTETVQAVVLNYFVCAYKCNMIFEPNANVYLPAILGISGFKTHCAVVSLMFMFPVIFYCPSDMELNAPLQSQCWLTSMEFGAKWWPKNPRTFSRMSERSSPKSY